MDEIAESLYDDLQRRKQSEPRRDVIEYVASTLRKLRSMRFLEEGASRAETRQIEL